MSDNYDTYRMKHWTISDVKVEHHARPLGANPTAYQVVLVQKAGFRENWNYVTLSPGSVHHLEEQLDELEEVVQIARAALHKLAEEKG